MNDSDVIIYTDGSSRGNPGPGGYGILMEECKSGFIKEFSKGFKLTTNNRMELLAVIDSLKKLKKESLSVTIYTDSNYVDTYEHYRLSVVVHQTIFKRCRYVRTYVCTYVRTYARTYIRMCAYIYTYVHIRYVCTQLRLYVCTQMYVQTYERIVWV